MSDTKTIVTAHVWIVAMTTAYKDAIAGKLMDRGYAVTNLSGGTFTQKGSPACFISLKIVGTDKLDPKVDDSDDDDKKSKHTRIRSIVTSCIRSTGALYYALIVEVDGSHAWGLGNIDMLELEKKKAAKAEEVEQKSIESEIDAAIYGPAAK